MDKADLENKIEKKFRDLVLETKIISYIIQKDYKISFLIDEESFTLEPYKFFLDVVRKTKMEYPKQILWRTVKSKILEDDLEIYKKYIKKIYDSDLSGITQKNIEKLCNKLLESQHSRKFFNLISDTISNVSKFDLNKTRFKFRNLIMTSDIKVRNSIDYVKNFEDRRDRIKEIAKDPKKLAGVPTGIKEFDEISGGVQKGEWGIIIAESGLGKSLTMGDIATNDYYKGYNVFIATFEMTNIEYAYRMDSKNARIDFSKFRKAELDIFDYEKWENKIQKYRERKKNFIRIEFFPRGSTIADVENSAYRIQSEEEQEIDIIFIDYLNLVSPTKSFGSTKDWKNQTDTAWELKEFVQTFNDGLGVAAWTGNQLTDEGQKAKKITTNHMKYARGISEVVPIIISLSQNEEAKLQDIVEMWVVKCRNFEKIKKPIILHPNWRYMMINDIDRIEE